MRVRLLDEGEYYDTYEEAEEEAQYQKECFEVELGGLDDYYSLVPVENLKVKIMEIDESGE